LLGIRLTEAQIDAFEIYATHLREWNQRISLTAIRTPDEIRIKHFLDSLSCLLAMRGTPTRQVADVGSGAGFPGIPLKIACPEMQLTLVESIGKKAAFLKHIVEQLGLEGVQVLPRRVEQLGQDEAHRGHYDWAVARAVGPLPVVCEYLLPLVKIGGRILAQKGESGAAEAHEAEGAIRILGGELRDLVDVTLPGVVEERCLVVVEKVAATPDKYPRRVGIPAKRPLSTQ